MVLGKTNVGVIRKVNEDNYFCWEENDRFIMVVSDGMGGHKAGSVASFLVVSAIKDYAQKHDMFENPSRMIKNAISYANEIVYLQACSHKDRAGMGATVVVAVGKGRKAYIGNLGDSRAYVINQNGILQITEDHSYVNELVKNGVLTPEEAKEHPKKNEILKAIGVANGVFPDVFEISLKSSDKLLLCTDGLTNMVEDEAISDIINSKDDNETVLTKLIDLANQNGGTDNITVVVKR